MVVIIGMRGEPTAAEASVTLQQPDAHCVCVLPRELSLDRGTLAVAGCTGSRGWGLWVVTCACTQASWWQRHQRYCFMPVSGVHVDSLGSHPSLELI